MAPEPIHIATDDGSCLARVFRPPTGGGPGVLLYIDAVGMRPSMFAIAERIAAAGYVVLVPDIFYRSGAYTPPANPAAMFTDPVARNHWWTTIILPATTDRVMADSRFYFDALAGQPGVTGTRFGVVGYCMGGRLALNAAGHYPDRVAACASYHGGNLANDATDSPHLLAGKLRDTTVYIGAASDDESFPEAQAKRLEDALNSAHVSHVIETYAAKHGWVPTDMPVYDQAAAERHDTTLINLFDRTLGGAPPR